MYGKPVELPSDAPKNLRVYDRSRSDAPGKGIGIRAFVLAHLGAQPASIRTTREFLGRGEPAYRASHSAFVLTEIGEIDPKSDERKRTYVVNTRWPGINE